MLIQSSWIGSVELLLTTLQYIRSKLAMSVLPFAVGVGASFPESLGEGVVIDLQFGDLF